MGKAKVVVLGGGYGGLTVVTRLQKKLGLNEAIRWGVQSLPI